MTQKYLLTFSTSNLKLKFLGVIAICLFTLFAITSCGGAKDRKKEGAPAKTCVKHRCLLT